MSTEPVIEADTRPAEGPSYHDVEVEFGNLRIRIFDSSWGLRLICSRFGGWELWDNWEGKTTLLAGEYNKTSPLRVYVKGVMICDYPKPS